MISTHCATHTLYFRFDILDTAALRKVSTSLDKDHISHFVMKYSLHILIFLWYWSFKKIHFLFSMLLTTKRVGVFAKNIRLFRKLFRSSFQNNENILPLPHALLCLIPSWITFRNTRAHFFYPGKIWYGKILTYGYVKRSCHWLWELFYH